MSTISLTRGDTSHYRFTCVDAAGAALDLTGASAMLMVKARGSDDPLITKTETLGLSIVNPASGGLIDLELLPADTASLAPSHYRYDLQLVLGPYVYTVIAGTLELVGDITRSPVASTAAASATAYGATVVVT
jgi:hypothetical protein